jgi:hypothetical protein
VDLVDAQKPWQRTHILAIFLANDLLIPAFIPGKISIPNP